MLFKSGLEALNPGKIKITVTALDAASFIDHMSSGAMPVFFLAWAPDYIDPDNFVTPFYRSEGFYAPMIGYSNSTLDAKIAEAVIELDEDKRAEMYKTIVADMREECVYIWTAQTTNFFVGHDYIEGYYFNPMYSGLYYYDLAKKVSP